MYSRPNLASVYSTSSNVTSRSNQSGYAQNLPHHMVRNPQQLGNQQQRSYAGNGTRQPSLPIHEQATERNPVLQNNQLEELLSDDSQDLGLPIEPNESVIDDDEDSGKHSTQPGQLPAWMFTNEYILNHTPSRRDGISYESEIGLRRRGTKLIRDLSQYLKITLPICKESAYVFFHRFYMYRSFRHHEPVRIAMACLFMACKYENHPIPKENFIIMTHMLISNNSKLDKTSQAYARYCEDLIYDENNLIQVLGFSHLRIKHFNAMVVHASEKCKTAEFLACDFFKSAYQIASEINRLTTLCVQYEAPVIACVSIYLASCYRCVKLFDQWCERMFGVDDDQHLPLIVSIGEKYRTSFLASKLIRKIVNEREYIERFGPIPSFGETKPKSSEKSSNATALNRSSLSALINQSPDSAYSSSGSIQAPNSPLNQMIGHVDESRQRRSTKTKGSFKQPSSSVQQNRKQQFNNNNNNVTLTSLSMRNSHDDNSSIASLQLPIYSNLGDNNNNNNITTTTNNRKRKSNDLNVFSQQHVSFNKIFKSRQQPPTPLAQQQHQIRNSVTALQQLHQQQQQQQQSFMKPSQIMTHNNSSSSLFHSFQQR